MEDAPVGPSAAARRLSLRDYFEGTKDLGVGVFFVTPILLLYEVGIVAFGSRLRNGADVLFKTLFSILGQFGLALFNVLLFGAFLAAAARVVKRGKPLFALYVPMLAESLVYALLLTPTVVAMASVLGIRSFLLCAGSPSVGEESFLVKIFLAVGAGVYEEAFFRLGLLRLLESGALKLLKLKPSAASALAVIVGSLLFALFHHVGPLGEPLVLGKVVYRFLAGILLSILFLTRGFGVAVYTHALYDVLVFLRGVVGR